MSKQLLQVSHAIRVVPSDITGIPSIGVLQTGKNTSVVNNQLVDTNAKFTPFMVGQIVYISSGSTYVKKFISETVLELEGNIFTQSNTSYNIYQDTINDCVLYVGGAGDLRVTTTCGDTVVFNNIQAGTFLPVHVDKVWSNGTTATNIIALW